MKLLYYNPIKNILILFLIILGSAPCLSQKITVIELQLSKSTIPEGLTVDHATGDIFISSLKEDQITRSSPDGKIFSKVLERMDNGYSIGVGMDLWKDHLYALGSKDRGAYSILSIKNLKSNKLVTYNHQERDSTYFNDLAIDKDGNAYMTDTNQHSIYYFDKLNGKIHVYFESDEIKYPNGIAISEDQTKLFIDSYFDGIRILDLKRKIILNAKNELTSKKGIDGLKYWKGKLYMIINGGDNKAIHGLYSADLTNDESKIVNLKPLLIGHDKMDIPTTISISKGKMYILANSQLENLDQQTNQIIDTDKLTKTYVIQYNLN